MFFFLIHLRPEIGLIYIMWSIFQADKIDVALSEYFGEAQQYNAPGKPYNDNNL